MRPLPYFDVEPLLVQRVVPVIVFQTGKTIETMITTRIKEQTVDIVGGTAGDERFRLDVHDPNVWTLVGFLLHIFLLSSKLYCYFKMTFRLFTM